MSIELRNLEVSDTFKVAIKFSIASFLKSEDETLSYPSSFSTTERAYIQDYASKFSLKSKEKGTKSITHLVISKNEDSHMLIPNASFSMPPLARNHIHHFLKSNHLSKKEKHDMTHLFEETSSFQASQHIKRSGFLINVVPQVPPKPKITNETKTKLPIYQVKDDIIEAILSNQVIMISGEAGVGKTTQVPQFLLDYCCENKQPCRIICIQPRRISALSMSDRVATERGEKVGHTIGYQIKLESKLSPSTLLTFSTNGVILRTLMGHEQILSNITHIIVDEIHERDKTSDFLLVVLRYLLPIYSKLKLILMSASQDNSLFTQYFENCPLIKIPSKMHEVQEYYLEDILVMLNYCKDSWPKTEYNEAYFNYQKFLENWSLFDSNEEQFVAENYGVKINKEMEQAMDNAWLEYTPESFANMLQTLKKHKLPIDYQHSETSVTALMISAARGCLETTSKLIQFGASISFQSCQGWDSIKWASQFGQEEVIDFLCKKLSSLESNNIEMPKMNENCRLALKNYYSCINDIKVDLDLILSLTVHICSSSEHGSILIFLPSYADIIQLFIKISAHEEFQKQANYAVYTLHSKMQSSDLRKVFQKTPEGIRKIILSTNIAESSITIDDLVYVIDCGKVEQKILNPVSEAASFQSVWISKANAAQRKGRVGRCCNGFVYRLFSSRQFQFMDNFLKAEILRIPLHELCLQAKSLSPCSMSISNLISLAPESPLLSSIKTSINTLMDIEALNANEELTEIGAHLLDLPVDPMLGKMILYSVVLKCLDPILTIVCSLAYRDLFSFSSEPNKRCRISQIRDNFSENTFSDHMVLLRAFQSWQNAHEDGQEDRFCKNNFISSAVMEMITGMRSKLLGQLRASGFVRAKGTNDIRDLNTNSENWAVVKAALFVGIYPNVLRIDRNKERMITRNMNNVKIHTTSALFMNGTSKEQIDDDSFTVKNLKSDWLMFDNMTVINNIPYISSCTIINSMTIALFAGPARLPIESIFQSTSYLDDMLDVNQNELKDQVHDSVLKVNDWISFDLCEEELSMLLHLRQKWHSLFLRRMRNPSRSCHQNDEAILTSIVAVLSCAEQQAELQQPSGIGQRPRPVHLNFVESSSPDFNAVPHYSSTVISVANAGGNMAKIFQPNVNTRLNDSKRFFLLASASVTDAEYFIINMDTRCSMPGLQLLMSSIMNGNNIHFIISIDGCENYYMNGHLNFDVQLRAIKFNKTSCHSLPFKALPQSLSQWNLNKNASKLFSSLEVTLMEISPQLGSDLINLWNDYDVIAMRETQNNYHLLKGNGRAIRGRHDFN